MTLQEAIALIKHDDITAQATACWADAGCGTGLFTFALANLLQKGSTIYAIDKLPVTLRQLSNPHHIGIHTRQMDFIKDTLPYNNLTGILMANSFHYVADKMGFIAAVDKQLQGSVNFLMVEYDTNTPNPWVPYPINSHALQALFAKAGYYSFIKLGETTSLYNTGNIYAALIKK